MNTMNPNAEAAQILAAHASRRTLAPISDRVGLSLDDAYAIQSILTQARLDRGERVIGWKLGYTSLAMRQQMRIDAPNFGPLTDAMLLDSGSAVPGSFTQPRVEPEVGLRFRHDVPAGADRGAVLACVASAHACLEIVDSVWADYRFKLEDNTADGSSAAAVVVGPPLPLGSIETVEVELSVDGVAAGRGRGSDASGHPADGVVWLVAQLAARGMMLRAGDLVITGGLTQAAPLLAGSTIDAHFAPADAKVAIRRT
jgi:2-keto-4-pentenoate hydratase